MTASATARRSALTDPIDRPTVLQRILRTWLGVTLAFAGVSHLTSQREAFQAQVPAWVPVGEDLVVVVSGVVEVTLGLALVALLVPSLSRWRAVVGLVVAMFFVVIFPGNVGQWLEGKAAFGLDTDAQRVARLFFQPVLVVWALWSTGAWSALVDWRRRR